MTREKALRNLASLSMALFCIFLTATYSQARDAALTKGWDMGAEPLAFGQVSWSVADGQGANNFKVSFRLSGSKPNHEFTVGLHLFNPANLIKNHLSPISR